MTFNPKLSVAAVGLMATTEVERRVIADLAEAGVFGHAGFVEGCVVGSAAPHVDWWGVEEFAAELPTDDPRRGLLVTAVRQVRSAYGVPPATVGELEVAIEVDGVSGPTLATWRDDYLRDDQAPYAHQFVNRCVDELQRRDQCWRCGRPASGVVEDLRVCSACGEAS